MPKEQILIIEDDKRTLQITNLAKEFGDKGTIAFDQPEIRVYFLYFLFLSHKIIREMTAVVTFFLDQEILSVHEDICFNPRLQ